MPNVLIAGGGSGGHVAPAIAVAEALVAQGSTCTLAISHRAIDARMLSSTTFESFALPAAPLKLSIQGGIRFLRGFAQTEQIVRTYIEEVGIDCVVSTGGFVCAPALRAARKAHCPTVMLNLDDPPGKANRLASRWADCILTTVDCALPNAERIPPPVRSSVLATARQNETYTAYGLDPQKLMLLVTGASQGATSINACIPELAMQNPTFFQGWQVVHLTGTGNDEEVSAKWGETDVQYCVLEFEEQMGTLWGITDLAITRGGANTIAELAINAVPAVVLPYPYHKDDHQRTNAEQLRKVGGVLVEKDYINTTKNLAHAGNTILALLKDHQKRFAMRQALASQTPINGSTCVADACMRISTA